MSLFKSIATFGGFTLVSRITGFARDMILANFLGAGAVSDAFFVACPHVVPLTGNLRTRRIHSFCLPGHFRPHFLSYPFCYSDGILHALGG